MHTLRRIVSVVLILMIVASCVACDGEKAPVTTQQGTENPKEIQQVLYDEEGLKITFVRAFEEPSINGVFYLQLLVENNFDQKAWVYLDNTSVNGYSTTVMSAVPMEIEPGKKSQAPFIISFTNLDTDSLDGISSIEFTVVAKDAASFELLVETDTLSIDF